MHPHFDIIGENLGKIKAVCGGQVHFYLDLKKKFTRSDGPYFLVGPCLQIDHPYFAHGYVLHPNLDVAFQAHSR